MANISASCGNCGYAALYFSLRRAKKSSKRKPSSFFCHAILYLAGFILFSGEKKESKKRKEPLLRSRFLDLHNAFGISIG